MTHTEAFAVVAEPGRRRILDLLLERERAVGELVEVRAEAQRRVYRVRAEPLRAIDAWLAPYRARWPEALDALATHLDTMDDEEAT